MEKEGGSPETTSSRGGTVSSKRNMASRPVKRHKASLSSQQAFLVKDYSGEKKGGGGGGWGERRNKILFSSS